MTAMAVPLEQDGEVAVFRAIQQGDRYALGELVSRHARWVRGLIYAQLGDPTATEDVLQRVWLRVWQQAGSLRDIRTWRGWLCQLARNAAYDELRSRRHEREGVARVVSSVPAEASEERRPDHEMAAEERRRLVLNAIQGLAAIYREPLVLRHLENWSYQEIADLLRIPVDTVETRLVRARRLLREALRNKV